MEDNIDVNEFFKCSLVTSLLGGGGEGGGYFRNFMTGVCGPNLEDTPYSYKGQARKPYPFI